MSPVDGHFLGHVVSRRANQSCGTHQDQRLGRQVDVLLVLCGIGRNRFVAKLRQLDPDLPGSHQIGSATHHGPVPASQCVAVGYLGNLSPLSQHLTHSSGQVAQASQHLGTVRSAPGPNRVGHRHGQQHPSYHLGIEGLRGCHAHLHVTTVRRVQHSVGSIH